MRTIVIQDESGSYYTPDKRWASHRGAALAFSSTIDALAHAVRDRLESAHVVVLSEGECRVRIAVPIVSSEVCSFWTEPGFRSQIPVQHSRQW
jgi:hypothetical protein